MSTETVMDTVNDESNFCSICLRTRAEVKLDPISNKMFQMFFVDIVKCVESMKADGNICVWCRQRVINALKLVDTARAANRILTNMMQIDKSHCQSSKQIVWDQIQATKLTHIPTPRASRVMLFSLSSETGIGSSVKLEGGDGIFSQERNVGFDSVINEDQLDEIQGIKKTSRTSQVALCGSAPDRETVLLTKLEHEDGIFIEEGNVCFDSAINEDQLNRIRATEEVSVLTSRISQVVSGNLSSDMRIDSSVKMEHEDGISVEERNGRLDGSINEDEMDHKNLVVLGSYNSLASRLGSEIDDELTSELNIAEKAPGLHEARKLNKTESEVVMKKEIKETDLNKTVYIEVPKLEPVDADGNQNLLSEVANDNLSSEFGKPVLKNRFEDGKNCAKFEGSGSNSQTAYSSADALKHIRLSKLTEPQRLQELEERRQEERYLNAPFKCEPCAIYFNFRNTYDTHMERHTESSGSHKCSVCGVYVKYRKSYLRHCKEHYERYECMVCGFNSPRRHMALVHLVSQHTTKRFKCEHCTSAFGKISALKRHTKRVHNAELPFFPCLRCSQVLNTKILYKRHMAQHKRSRIVRLHRCKVCPCTFRSAFDLRRHQSTHSKEKTFSCQYCGDVFKRPSTLHKHTMKRHSGVCFECDHCQKTFRMKRELRKHIIYTHLGRGHICQFCSEVLLSSFLLERHIKQEHKGSTESKEKVCEDCGQGFSRYGLLSIHRRIHSMERPYSCTACTATYKYRSGLERHKLTVHKIKD